MKLEKFANWLKTQNIQAHDSLRKSLDKTYKTPAPTLVEPTVAVDPVRTTTSTLLKTQQATNTVSTNTEILDEEKVSLAKIGFYLSDDTF